MTNLIFKKVMKSVWGPDCSFFKNFLSFSFAEDFTTFLRWETCNIKNMLWKLSLLEWISIFQLYFRIEFYASGWKYLYPMTWDRSEIFYIWESAHTSFDITSSPSELDWIGESLCIYFHRYLKFPHWTWLKRLQFVHILFSISQVSPVYLMESMRVCAHTSFGISSSPSELDCIGESLCIYFH